MATATVENDVDKLCESTETLGLVKINYDSMEAKEDPHIRWDDLTNDAMAIHFVNKYFMTAAGSLTLMYYVEENAFYLFNGVYWKRLSDSAQELIKLFPNDGSSDQQFLVHLWSAFKATEKDLKEDEAANIFKNNTYKYSLGFRQSQSLVLESIERKSHHSFSLPSLFFTMICECRRRSSLEKGRHISPGFASCANHKWKVFTDWDVRSSKTHVLIVLCRHRTSATTAPATTPMPPLLL